MSLNTADRFWTHVDKRERGCWVWKQKLLASGYGRFRFQGRSVRAHRLAWELTHGNIPDGLIVIHACDNPSCVKPSHLMLGTCATNNADRSLKGRSARGERHHNAKLTAEKVRAIRQAYVTAPRKYGAITNLVREHGVSYPTILEIIKRQTWRHV